MKIEQCSLFSGIGAFEKALKNNGVDFEITSYCEIDKYASCAYAAIHGVSEYLNLGDVSKVNTKDIPYFNLLTWGFPCQDISVAGKQAGIKVGTRSGLYYEGYRILKDRLPKYSIIENVKNLTSKKHIDKFHMILDDLSELGYRNYWGILNAKDFGVPQNRERVFIVSILGNGEFEMPIGKDSGIRLKDILETEVEEKYYIDNEKVDKLTERLINKKDEKTLLVGKTGTHQKDGIYSTGGLARTILATEYTQPMQICETNNIKQVGMLNIKGNEQIRRVYDSNGVSPCLNTMQGGNRQPKIVEESKACRVVGRNPENPKSRKVGLPTQQMLEINKNSSITNTLTTVQKDNVVLQNNYRIRKLTPLECWRLMGFGDEDFFKAKKAICDKFYNGKDRSNSQLYKMAGNSIVVNVPMAIFKELL